MNATCSTAPPMMASFSLVTVSAGATASLAGLGIGMAAAVDVLEQW